MKDFAPPPPHLVSMVRQMANRPLSADEFAARLAREPTSEELRDRVELIRWYLRRYPTPESRLRHARHAYRLWARGMPQSS